MGLAKRNKRGVEAQIVLEKIIVQSGKQFDLSHRQHMADAEISALQQALRAGQRQVVPGFGNDKIRSRDFCVANRGQDDIERRITAFFQKILADHPSRRQRCSQIETDQKEEHTTQIFLECFFHDFFVMITPSVKTRARIRNADFKVKREKLQPWQDDAHLPHNK